MEYKRNDAGDFVCPHCDKVVPKEHQNTMHYHMKLHDGELPHKCSYCKSEFQHKGGLDMHKMARHPERMKSVEKLECPVDKCPYSSITKANLKIHFLRIHCKTQVNAIKEGSGSDIGCKSCKCHFKSSTAYYYHVGACIKGDAIPHFKEVV